MQYACLIAENVLFGGPHKFRLIRALIHVPVNLKMSLMSACQMGSDRKRCSPNTVHGTGLGSLLSLSPTGFWRDAAFPGHDSSCPADRAHARRPASCFGLLRRDHAQGRSFLPC